MKMKLKMKQFGLMEIFKSGGRGGGSLEPPLDPPLNIVFLYCFIFSTQQYRRNLGCEY